MSRIGKKTIEIPSGVNVKIDRRLVTVEGPKGVLSMTFAPGVDVVMSDNHLNVTRKNETQLSRALHGTTRQIIYNMIKGVSEGWSKSLEVVGTGFRVTLNGDKLVLALGFSHLVEIKAPEGISFTVSENKITVSGIDKGLVGQITANIRATKPPDPYKGKGIRLAGEKIKLKPGKQAKVGGAVAGAKGAK